MIKRANKFSLELHLQAVILLDQVMQNVDHQIALQAAQTAAISVFVAASSKLPVTCSLF